MTQIEIKPPKTRSGRPVVPTRPRGTQADAAADAVGFLRRLGFAVMVALLPIAAVIMRHAVVVIAPVGAILFSMAMLIESEGREPFRRMWKLVRTQAAVLLLFLLFLLSFDLLGSQALALGLFLGELLHIEVEGILVEGDRVIVEGINLVKRHVRPTPKSPQGGILEKEAPLHMCKVMPVDPKTGKPTRVRFAIDAKGRKNRIAVKSGEELPNPTREDRAE